MCHKLDDVYATQFLRSNRLRIPHDTMDPASAIIGMASFGFTVFKNVNRVCKDIKNAPEQLRSIEDSCDHVQLLLNQLQVASTAKQSHYDVPYLERQCTRAQRYLEEVDVAINKVTTNQGTEDHRPERRHGAVRRVKWILKSDGMKDIAQKLDKLQTTLALIVITLRLDNQGPSTASSPHSPHYNAGIDRDRTSSYQSYSSRSSLHCKTDCKCSCHSLSLRSLIPTSLAAYLGQIYVSRRLLSALWSTYNLCSVSDCHGDLKRAITVHWILPAGSLSGCLQSSPDPSRRIHFSLCLPRTIPFDSPVLHAIYGVDVERIRTLFSTGQASIWDHDVAGHPIVSHACRQWLRYRAEEQLAIVRFLVEAGSDALLLAGPPGYCLAQDWLILGLLQCLLVDGTTAGRSLAACIQTSSVAVHVFRSILSMDSVDALEDYLSRYGYSEKHLEHLRILLETAQCGEARFSMFNAIGYTPLEYAICFAPSSVRALLKEGADATAEPSLAYAAQHGRVDVIEALIDSGADVNMADDSGQTALHWACYRCNYEEFFELVLHAENDIDWNLRTPEGLNALDLFDLSISDGLASHWTPDEISEFRAVLVTHVDSSEPSVLRNEALDSVFIMMPGAFPTDIA